MSDFIFPNFDFRFVICISLGEPKFLSGCVVKPDGKHKLSVKLLFSSQSSWGQGSLEEAVEEALAEPPWRILPRLAPNWIDSKTIAVLVFLLFPWVLQRNLSETVVSLRKYT